MEGHVFHNRLTHTLEVAQIARRLAERLVATQGELAAAVGGIDPDVVEAAALIHDLGHPPFGHAAEVELHALVCETDEDGFEGNPQSFRIVTRLAAHRVHYRGLNLTRATLNAALKYPKLRPNVDVKKLQKFGAFRSDQADFHFAREGMKGEEQCAEAEIMDHADGIAYSVHDLDDFYRAGLIPLDRLSNAASPEFDEFLEDWKKDPEKRGISAAEIDAQRDAFLNWLQATYIRVPLRQTWHQSAGLRTITAEQIAGFVNAVRLTTRDGKHVLEIPAEQQLLLRFCQRLVWRYVIKNPRLATQQEGQRHIVRGLFEFYHRAVSKQLPDLVPARFYDDVSKPADGVSPARLAADIVSSLTDAQSLALHRRITGVATGSVTSLL